MRARVRRKIAQRFLDLDEVLSQCFYRGGLKTYRREIGSLRGAILYWRRRYPGIYQATFGRKLDLGHLGSGR